MICCLSICSNCTSSGQLNDPKEILVTSREKHTDITGNEGVSPTEFVFLLGLGQLWLNRTQRGFFSKGDRNYLQKPEQTLYPRLCMFALLLMPTYWILQLSASVLQPAFIPADVLPRIYRHFLLFFSRLTPSSFFYFTAPFCSLSMCCCNMNPSPDPVKRHMFLIILI